ncbi:MAG: HAD family hydrolase [Lachnospiraceae bacterium]|nr:HAD family hydrolase [Lachnospiraceae bacterium]
MIKAVLLDIDNTLFSFDGYVQYSMKHGFEKYGLRLFEDWMPSVFHRINNELWGRIEKGTLTFEELGKIRWNLVFRELGIVFDGVVFEQYFRKELFRSAIPEDGALDLVTYLSGRYILGIASNGPYAQQVNRLKIAGIHEKFQYIFVSEKLGVSKPAKAFFQSCLEEMNRQTGITDRKKEIIRPEEVMIIGDSMSSDMTGGIGFGMKTCFYNRKGITLPENSGVDYVVRELKEIENIL